MNILQELRPQQPERVDNPADLVPARSYVRAIVGGLILLIGGVLALTRAFRPLPDFETLTKFEGTIAEVVPVRSKRTGLSNLFRDPAVIRYDTRFVNRSANYKYAAGRPKSSVLANLRPGERVTVWSDVRKTYSILQLEREGHMLIAFEEELEEIRRDRRFDLYIYGPLLLVLAGICFWAVGRLHLRYGTRRPATTG